MRSRSSRSNQVAPPALLFTYGTLMRGYGLHRFLAAGGTFVGMARMRGRLLDLGPYPGLVAGDGQVHGEVYRLADAELLRALDREEGYNFHRRRTIVTLVSGRRARAWVYEYRGPRGAAVLLPDGDWRRAHARPESLAERSTRRD